MWRFAVFETHRSRQEATQNGRPQTAISGSQALFLYRRSGRSWLSYGPYQGFLPWITGAEAQEKEVDKATTPASLCRKASKKTIKKRLTFFTKILNYLYILGCLVLRFALVHRAIWGKLSFNMTHFARWNGAYWKLIALLLICISADIASLFAWKHEKRESLSRLSLMQIYCFLQANANRSWKKLTKRYIILYLEYRLFTGWNILMFSAILRCFSIICLWAGASPCAFTA